MPPTVALLPGQTAFAGNDYLGLAGDPRLAEALYEGARTYGISSMSSRWALGWTELHARLERGLAEYFGAEDACVLGATYMGGAVYFEVMRRAHATVFCDATAHSNLFLGMKAAGFTIESFRHLDAEDLRRKLAAHRGPPPVVATDGVYGISGEVAPLDAIRDAARAHGAPLFIDDAHGVFAVGPTGRGSAEARGLAPGDAVVLGSLSKALGCNGGFLLGTRDEVEAFRRSTPVCGASQPIPPLAAAALRALEIVREDPGLRARMWSHAERMRAAAREHGLGVVSEESPIVALTLADEAEARALDAHLRTEGLVAPYFKYPSEPRHNL
ncbi:MAG: pyridoxal phosphate-dependent aminotransferase family protein, partial [Planctomycetota bacterium]|nr:pyridoxal phosphate-dependent aminotransferase family protein [Planctomycetota bacterium]